MLIILDYDDTYTATPATWDSIISIFKNNGDTVICCTNRVGNEYYDKDVINDMNRNDVPIVFAAMYKDKWEAVEMAGYDVKNAIWIDDRPMYVWLNRDYEELG